MTHITTDICFEELQKEMAEMLETDNSVNISSIWPQQSSNHNSTSL